MTAMVTGFSPPLADELNTGEGLRSQSEHGAIEGVDKQREIRDPDATLEVSATGSSALIASY